MPQPSRHQSSFPAARRGRRTAHIGWGGWRAKRALRRAEGRGGARGKRPCALLTSLLVGHNLLVANRARFGVLVVDLALRHLAGPEGRLGRRAGGARHGRRAEAARLRPASGCCARPRLNDALELRVDERCLPDERVARVEPEDAEQHERRVNARLLASPAAARMHRADLHAVLALGVGRLEHERGGPRLLDHVEPRIRRQAERTEERLAGLRDVGRVAHSFRLSRRFRSPTAALFLCCGGVMAPASCAAVGPICRRAD